MTKQEDVFSIISCSCALSLRIRNRCWSGVGHIRNGEHVRELLIRKKAFKRGSAVVLHGTGHDRLLLRRACWGLAGLLGQTELHYLGENGFLEAYWSRGELTRDEMLRKDIHKHGVDLYTRSVSMHTNRQPTTGSLTHILQILFANLHQRRDLLDFLYWQMRENSGEDDVVACNQRLFPEGTLRDVIRTFVLELLAEGIPETSVIHFGMGVDTENADCWISRGDSCRTLRKPRKIITLSFSLAVFVSVKPGIFAKGSPCHRGYSRCGTGERLAHSARGAMIPTYNKACVTSHFGFVHRDDCLRSGEPFLIVVREMAVG